jgi:hypothetical protein
VSGTEEAEPSESVADLKHLLKELDLRLSRVEAAGPPDYEQNRRTGFRKMAAGRVITARCG